MITAEEVETVPIFGSLGSAEREQLAQAAAGITPQAGEFAVHEGSERALFVVLDGRIEPVKTVDGIDRVVGVRNPGDIFGEVPMSLGTVFPVGVRAAERSRVMR